MGGSETQRAARTCVHLRETGSGYERGPGRDGRGGDGHGGLKRRREDGASV